MLIDGGLNVEPNMIPSFAKGVSAGIWVDVEAAFARVMNSL